MDTHTLQEALIRISRAAGQRILNIYNDPSRFEIVDFKADDSPLTQADRDANELIVEQLAALTPDVCDVLICRPHLPRTSVTC